MDQTPTWHHEAQPNVLATAVDVFDDPFAGMSWYVLIAQPGRQELARDSLLAEGYGAYLPMCRIQRRRSLHGGRPPVTEIVDQPLYPRYLFAGVGESPGQSFAALLRARGVSFAMRGRAGAPPRVPRAALQEIARRCAATGGVLDLVPGSRQAQWVPGQMLRVTEGPMAGKVGALAWADRTTASVVFDLFGRPTPVRVSVEKLEPTEAPIAIRVVRTDLPPSMRRRAREWAA